jgi:hypothetical protein
MRLNGHKIDDNDLNTLIKKYHLIFLTDECERILIQKIYKSYNIETLSICTIISFIWFLLEMQKSMIFPIKVEKVLKCLPSYISKSLQNSDDKVSRFLLLLLTEKTIKAVSDENIRNHLRKVNTTPKNPGTLITAKA